jgi:protein O-GlcNAc transferase
MQANELENIFKEAVAKQAAQDYVGARLLYDRILAVRPNHPDVLFRLGGLCYETKAYAEAIDCLRRAAAQRPGSASIDLMLAMSLTALKRYAEAEPLFLRYGDLPDSDGNAAYAAFNLASLYFEWGNFEKARALCMRSLARFPGDRAFIFLLGQSCLQLRCYDDAILAFDELMKDDRMRLKALLAASGAFRAKKDYHGFLRRAEPEVARSGDSELMVTLGDFYMDMGDLDRLIAVQAEAMKLRPEDYHLHSYQIKAYTQSDAVTEKQVFEIACDWDRKFGHPKDVPPFASWLNGPLNGRRIRLGILSKTFRRHVTQTILRPLLPELAKRFELYGYYDDTRTDEYTDEVQRSFAAWRNTSGLGEAEAAKLIHVDALDALIDISGHFNGARTRILTYRPAPVQIHYADSSSSLGIKAVAYRFSDAIAEPPGRGDPYSSETVLRLPNGFFLYQPLFDLPAAAPCPAELNGYITFGSCAALSKITPTTLRLWKSALDAVPGSIFLLARDELENDTLTREYWTKRFVDAGIGLDRFRLESGSRDDFVKLRFYDRIDIALDVFPYSGVTTTLDGLWMGVPMINYRETRFINRVCSSLLTRVGLQDLVAERFDDFAKIAANLAADRDRRRKLRRTLRDTMRLSPLCDPVGMAVDMENAIRGVLGCL